MINILAFVILIGWIAGLGHILYNSKSLEDYKEDFGDYNCERTDSYLARWKILKEGLKVTTFKSILGHIHIFYQSSNFLTVFITIVFIGKQSIQLLFPLLMIGMNIFVTLKYKPFKNKTMNFLASINLIAYFVSRVILYILYLEEDREISFKFYYFGYPLITIMTATLIINSIVCLNQTFYLVKPTLSDWGTRLRFKFSRVNTELDES